MPKKKYILTIPEPCHEQWSKMSPCGGGRFCGSCRKTVVDFTNLCDSSVVRVLEQANGEVCGRVNTTQLDRIVSEQETSISIFRKLLKIAAGILLPALLHTPEAKAQGGVIMREASVPKPCAAPQDTLTPHGAQLPHNEKEGIHVIHGTVLDSLHRQPQLGVSVIASRALKIATTTDLDGNFKLEFPDSLLAGDSLTLELLYIGYEPATVRIPRQNFQLKQEFLIGESKGILLGEMIIIRHERGTGNARTKEKKKR